MTNSMALRDTRRGALAESRSALMRLVIAAVVLFAAVSSVGYLLTHPLRDTAFERWDGSVNEQLARHRNASLNTATHWLTYTAETLTVVAIGALFFIALRLLLGRWRESMFLAAALAGEVLIFVVTSLLIDRHRPPVPHLDSAPPTSSFPSGHTAAAVTLYVALAVIAVHASRRSWLRTLSVLVAVAVPVGVAAARLYRGMHFPTDVLGGATLAVAWLAITWAVVLRGHDARPLEGGRGEGAPPPTRAA